MTQQTRETSDRRIDGPFPMPQAHSKPWESTESEHGPFERRRGPDRRAGELPVEGELAVAGEEDGARRRGWGRRKADVLTTEAKGSLTGRSRRTMRRLREPLIGLTLAGVAAPLINAGVNAPAQPGSEAARKATAEKTAQAAEADRDVEGAVGDYWAAEEDRAVRENTIEGAMTRYDIDRKLATQIYEAAEKHNIEADVAYGLVYTESTFRQRAVSHVGARGLTQLMPRTAKWLDPTISTQELFNNEKNLELGFRYLRQMIDKYEGNVEHALTAYNRGPGTVDRILDRGGNPDNGYAGKVLSG